MSNLIRLRFISLWILFFTPIFLLAAPSQLKELSNNFLTPPDSARPGVYWYIMDGCLSKSQITEDLESMKDVGIGSVLFLEVNLGMPRGHLDFFSSEWKDTFLHAVRECERLGIEMILGVGPGWNGSGGPWVEPSESMRHLVGSETIVCGNGTLQSIGLPVPLPRSPYFGEGVLTPELKAKRDAYYQDVKVLALPNINVAKVDKIDEKALYYRSPFSSMGGVPPVLPEFSNIDCDIAGVSGEDIIDVTEEMDSNGVLHWRVPDGEWRILRMGMRNNGAISRPAPLPGLGFECDKMDSSSFKKHFFNSFGSLFPEMAPSSDKKGGLKGLHMDSWEMGSQNWTDDFTIEFEKRRGYSPVKYLPAVLGICVEDMESSERFLRDLRKTIEEMILEHHAYYIRSLAHEYGLKFSIEPYDMTPLSDIRLCEAADVPMCEFWTPAYGFNTTYGGVEATSVAHIKGRSVVAAEAFTTNSGENLGFAYYPGNIKEQGDWAFAFGINKFMYHTFVHKYFDNDMAKPGMTMGGYGVNWDRGQTWWHMSGEYHKYVARCSYMLRQGRTSADILYLTGEDAPNVFKNPESAVRFENSFYPDRREYNFDACAPATLISDASVSDEGKIVFKSGAEYEIMFIPQLKSMSIELLDKIESLIADGATVIGNPPLNTGSLYNAQKNDAYLRGKAESIWGTLETPENESVISYCKGTIYWGGSYSAKEKDCLYPSYEVALDILKQKGVIEDYKDDTDAIRYTHRMLRDADIFFLSNTRKSGMTFTGRFRTDFPYAEIWNPVTGEMKSLSVTDGDGNKYADLQLDGNESCFIVFSRKNRRLNDYVLEDKIEARYDISNDWSISFDPEWGGPEKIIAEKLTDWKESDDERIKYYSGSAFYKKEVNIQVNSDSRAILKFESVYNIAGVYVNGKYVTTLWTTPWETDITDYIKDGKNIIEVEVANLWVNRLIKDMSIPENKDLSKWPEWLFNRGERNSSRLTFATVDHYRSDSPLVPSGLVGKVEILFK